MYAEQSLAGARQVPELGRLKHAAERISKTTYAIDAFIERFHGPLPSNGATVGAGLTASDNYRNDLDSLFAVLDRLEATVGQLESIG